MIKKQTFIQGVTIIAISRLIVKIIGAVYKIPLDRFVLGAEGMGIYSAAYTIYNWLIVISTVGLPVAISKMVAEQIAVENYKSAGRILRISTTLLLFIGIIGASIMFFGAGTLAGIISTPSATLSLMALAPSLIFVSINSSYRGYYQGLQNMNPTAGSEVVEASFKLFLGLMLAFTLKNAFEGSLKHGAMGGILGVTISTVMSFIFLIIYHNVHKRKIPKTDADPSRTYTNNQFFSRIIKIAVPITLGASAFNLTALLDTAMVLNQLAGLGFSESARTEMYGHLNRAITLFNMPLTVVAAIAITIVPSIASAVASRDNKLAQNSVKMAIKLSLFIAVPCAIGLSTLAKPILTLIYTDGNYFQLLTVMGIALIFATLVQVSGSVLQAYGRVWDPVVHLIIGGSIKVVVNVLLVSIPEINIYGAPIGTLLCHLTVMSLNIYRIRKVSGTSFEFKTFILKPGINAFVVFVLAISSYNLLSFLGNALATIIAIAVAGVGYLVSILVTKSISKDDLLFMPKGDKIGKVLNKFIS